MEAAPPVSGVCRTYHHDSDVHELQTAVAVAHLLLKTSWDRHWLHCWPGGKFRTHHNELSECLLGCYSYSLHHPPPPPPSPGLGPVTMTPVFRNPRRFVALRVVLFEPGAGDVPAVSLGCVRCRVHWRPSPVSESVLQFWRLTRPGDAVSGLCCNLAKLRTEWYLLVRLVGGVDLSLPRRLSAR